MGKIIVWISVIVFIFCIGTLCQELKESAETFISYRSGISKMKKEDNCTKLEIPVWEWEKLIQIGTIEEISSSFATLLKGNKNNLVIAGHDTDLVFHALQQIKIGMKISLWVEKKHSIYQVQKILKVYPEEVKYLAETKNEQLTLITCTEQDKKRLVIICSKIE